MQRIILLLLSGLTLASPAQAQNESVYMMQLGSFETEQLAQEAWGSIKAKYPNVLGNISAQVRSVSLPPDDLTVYRTQAGPVSSRDIADRLCNQLTQAGDECYVVETAMVAFAQAPTPIAQATHTIENIATQATNSVPQFVQNAQNTLPTNIVPEALPIEEPASLALQAMADVPEIPAPPAPTIQLDAPQDPQPRKARTLFGELFGEESDALYQNSTPSPARTQVQAPQLDTPAIPTAPTGLTIAAEPAQIAAIEPLNPLANLQLPAPPPPAAITTGKRVETPAIDLAQTAPTPAQVAVTQPQAAPISIPLNSPFKPAQNAAPSAQHTVAGAAHLQEQQAGGQVAVAEAIPVPLSRQNPTVPVQPAPAVTPFTAQELASRGLPSQATADRTYWAQISTFNSQQEALAFWDIFRRQNPQFPAVRVRVTQPYAKSKTGERRVSLRVGPFDGAGMVGVLCKALPQSNANCGVVADLGTSATANKPRYRGNQNRYAARYGSSQRPGGAQGYYVQLGAYRTPAAAEFEWQELQRQEPALLGSLRADISSPNLSSGSGQSFRLRTGPYLRVASATQLCGRLKQRGVRCLVVSGR